MSHLNRGLAAAAALVLALWMILALWMVVSLVGDDDPTPIGIDATSQSDAATSTPSAQDVAPVDVTREDTRKPASRFSDLDTVTPGELPLEALDTLDLIASGGPYPFSQDDSTFQNRERILPDREAGHYREYTVITPREDDRGARRIVAGADGERYYTEDHYDSFREIVLQGP